MSPIPTLPALAQVLARPHLPDETLARLAPALIYPPEEAGHLLRVTKAFLQLARALEPTAPQTAATPRQPPRRPVLRSSERDGAPPAPKSLAPLSRWATLDSLPADDRDRILYVVDSLIREAKTRHAFGAR